MMDLVDELGEAFDDSDGNRADGADTRYHRQGIRHLEYNEGLLCPRHIKWSRMCNVLFFEGK